MKNWYNKTVEETIKECDTDIKKGLSPQVVANRLAINGTNEFEKPKKESMLKLLIHPIKDISSIILLIAAALSFVMAFTESKKGFIAAFVILAVIVINITLSVTQQLGAEKALDALNALNSPHSFVLRDGIIVNIATKDVVVGDIVVLKTGNLIPADSRVIESENLVVDEASLTGESEPVKKKSAVIDAQDAGIGDQNNMIFSGCMVAGVHGRAIVVATGMDTQMGKIAKYLNTTKKRKTPLQTRLDKLGKTISIIAILAAVAIFALGLIEKQEIMSLILLAITLAVAAVPETLGLIVTIILTHGIRLMVTKNVIIRKLQAVETLGSTSVICSDKTGTLTQNKMTVKRMWLYGQDIVDDDNINTDSQISFVKSLLVASNATIEYDLQQDGTKKERIIGDPTESAIVRLAIKLGIDVDSVRAEHKRVVELPFSSSRKMMSVVLDIGGGKYQVLTKGAFDRLPYIVESLEYKQSLQTKHDLFAYDALRVITLATKTIDFLPNKDDVDKIEKDLNFIGIVGIIDPPRLDVKEAILTAKNAGIKVVMITGDHAATATAIARDLGIIAGKEGVITGAELANLTDDQLYNSVEHYSVYARVSPQDKIRIVQAWQRLGAVVSMTGDGVNDAPALKAADVGVSMGIAGTEVAKSASDMILTDDRFGTIVEAVNQGRNVFSNIRKLIYFLIVCNISEILIMLFGVLLFKDGDNWYLPVTPIMLLIVNILGDGIPAMAIAKETSDKRIMKRKPINRAESFFGGGMLEVIIQQAVIFAIVCLAAYYIGARINVGGDTTELVGQTMAFVVLGWTSVLHIFTVRSRKSMFKKGFKGNKQILISAIAMFVLIALLVIIPGLNSVLGMVNLSYQQWFIVIGLSLVPLMVAEYGKFWDEYKYKSSEKSRVNLTRIEK